MPKLVWGLALSGSQYNVSSLLEEASGLYAAPDFVKKKTGSKKPGDKISFLNGQVFGEKNRGATKRGTRRLIFSCYFIICYLGVKFLYLLNCLVQIGLIQLVVGARPFGVSRYNHYRHDSLDTHFLAQFVHKMSSGVSELIDTSSFPKRTLCDFTFRELASNHAYTVECILPLNIIVEKMYVFLYMWFILLAVLTALDFIRWIGLLVYSLVRSEKSHEDYVKSHLIDRTKCSAEDIQKFAKHHFSGNTYFILQLLSKNISTFAVVDMLDYYFKAQASNKKQD